MVKIQSLPNGLTVLVEEMKHVESAAYDLLIPGGIISDGEDHIGASLILAELTTKGAGKLDSRQLSDAFDNLGIRHGESAVQDKFAYGGSLLADKLDKALELVALMTLQPTLPEGDIESIRSILLQDIHSLSDNPARRVFVELGGQYYPAPYNRPGHGTELGLNNSDRAALHQAWSKVYRPEQAILSIAGNVQAEHVFDTASKLFGAWSGSGPPKSPFGEVAAGKRHHIQYDSAQLQIALAIPSVKFGDPLYYAAKVALGVLSGGMFGRLFIEVREKRGLCYSVSARHSSTADYGTTVAYAGTTPERAHETFQVMLDVLKGLRGTVTEEELARAKANLKAGLIMSDESSGSRASSNATDWWLMKRIRTLAEIQEGIDKVTATDIDQFIERYPIENYTLMTLGSRELK